MRKRQRCGIVQLAGSDRPATRQAVFRALGQLADGHHAGALVKLLADARDDATRTGVVGIFESLSERLPTGQGLDTAPIVRGITKGDLGTRQALLQVCAFFASEPLRTALRAALQDDAAPLRAAAARALCDTQDPDLLPDLLTVARETADANLRSSAIEGIVRLVTDDTTSLTTEQRTDALVAANALATRTGDKRRVLSGLGRVTNDVETRGAGSGGCVCPTGSGGRAPGGCQTTGFPGTVHSGLAGLRTVSSAGCNGGAGDL